MQATHEALLPTAQRAELTFKGNRLCGRHGWLRLTPAYSVEVVNSILVRAARHIDVLDPFSGTGTTTLCAVMQGHNATATEINPFLVWFGRAKVAVYAPHVIASAKAVADVVLQSVRHDSRRRASPPPIYNIERWWTQDRLEFLCRLMGAIDAHVEEPGQLRDLLLVAFCRTMMSVSNAAFNHQSMSFKPAVPSEGTQPSLFKETVLDECCAQFARDFSTVLSGAEQNPTVTGAVVHDDSRCLTQVAVDAFDLLITSPPYPNRISYVRELRPYMYWLGYLKEAREAGDLDWQAIGGTWGIATSRVALWKKDDTTHFPEYLDAVLAQIRTSAAKSGAVLSCYVGKYFEDMWRHFESVRRVMRPGGQMHYVIGNSKFYDVLVPAETIYRDMLLHLGVKSVDVVPLRKRNSKKELIEFDVHVGL